MGGISCVPPIVAAEETIDEIRFTLGAERAYAWRYRESDSSNAFRVDSSDSFVVHVAAINDAIGGLSDLIRLEAWSERNPGGGKTYAWYRQTKDSLDEIAYAWVGRVPIVLPKRDGRKREVTSAMQCPFYEPFAVRYRISALPTAADSIIVRSDSRMVVRYPARKGSQWISFVSPFLQTREVVGVEEVTVPAGTFRCLKIQTKLPTVLPDIVWYDYLNREGMVARTITELIIRTDVNGEPTDTIRVSERLELTRMTKPSI